MTTFAFLAALLLATPAATRAATPSDAPSAADAATGAATPAAALPAADGAAPARLPSTIRDPRIVVHKARRELLVSSGKDLLKTYRIALGGNPVGPKRKQGDQATPEGSYVVCRKNPQSRFVLSLGLSYPNAADADRGLAAGLVTRAEHRRILESARTGACPPWNTALGGEVFIHGSGSASDWTWGCVALDDDDVRELYSRILVGTPVVIEP